jgi:hypothetical protein
MLVCTSTVAQAALAHPVQVHQTLPCIVALVNKLLVLSTHLQINLEIVQGSSRSSSGGQHVPNTNTVIWL